VDWVRPDTRSEALKAIGNSEYYGAIVIPEDYTQRISGLAGPPRAKINGRPVELGEEVANTITSPDSPAPDFVQWARLEGRAEAKKGFDSGEYYAAIVILKNYSQHLASLSGPPVGVLPLAQPPVLEPAEIELLTSPAVRPSTTAQIENAFTGIVGGVSGATSEQIFEGLSEQGVPVPQGAGR
jgi:hypothetical protein